MFILLCYIDKFILDDGTCELLLTLYIFNFASKRQRKDLFTGNIAIVKGKK